MALQTPVNGNKQRQPDGDVIGGVGSFSQNVASLATLQARLAALDMKECLSTAAPSIAACALAVAACIASVTIGSSGIALLLHANFALPLHHAFLYVGVGLFLFACVVLAFALRRIQRSCSVFRRSRDELERNIAWIKTVLAQSGR